MPPVRSHMGRKRLAKNRDLELYVLRDKKGYISYKHPKMDKPRTFGKGQDALNAANEVARIVNAKLSGQADIVGEILTPHAKSFNHVLDRFIEERSHDLQWSKDYKAEQLRRIDKFREYGGSKCYEDLTVLFFADMVDELFTGDSRRTAIYLLRHIDAYACGRGLRLGPNVAERILIPRQQERQRPRIKDFDEFQEIHAQGEDWEKDVLEFALITLQPRQVICMLDINAHIQGNKLRFQRGKTGVYIEIAITETLAPLIAKRRKMAMRYGTRRLFCRPPARAKGSARIQPGYLTRAITACILRTGLYAEDHHPTLHEVRSLGGRIYEQRGYPKQLIQDLMGHKKPSTTEIYLNPDEPKYIKNTTLIDLNSLK